MIDAVQLKQIICGAEIPVDTTAIRRKATYQGWADDEQDYIETFWRVVGGFSEASKVRFVVFLTASAAVPLQGWEGLRVVIQKNGDGDDRFPLAHTCFSLLLLP